MVAKLNFRLIIFFLIFFKLQGVLNSQDKILRNSKILILGVAYKKDISDTRESPSLDILELLIEKNAEVSFYDPFVKELTIAGQSINKESLSKNFHDYDMLLILTPHTEFSEIDFEILNNIVFDTTGSNFIKSTERI